MPRYSGPPEVETVRYLEERLFDGFRRWSHRARTFRGRLLVAHTMVLSRLWRYKVHVNIPVPTLRRWQALLNKFVLTRRYDPASNHFQLLLKEFLYQKRVYGGLQKSSIEAQLKRQRPQIMHQFIAKTQASECNWTTPGVILTKLIMPNFGPWRSLDILTVSPYRHGTMMRWHAMSEWWKQSCTWWHQVKWSVTYEALSVEDKYELLLQRLHIDRTNCRPIGMIPEPDRGFRKHVAQRFRLHCLSDFFGAGDTWPSCNVFVDTYVDYTLQSPTVYTQAVMLKRLYKELTQVMRRVCSIRTHPPSAAVPRPLHFGVATSTRSFIIPNIPRKFLLGLVWTPAQPQKHHPVIQHSAVPPLDVEIVAHVVRRQQRMRRLLLPIFDDLQFRVAFKLLPVRSRFWFLQPTNPGIICCVRGGCNAVETVQHLFLDCTLARQLWSMLQPAWMCFFELRATWNCIATARLPPVLTLHFIWSDCNRCNFKGRLPTPTVSAFAVILTTFSAHVRYCMRRLYVDKEDTVSLQAVLEQLKCAHNVGSFMDTHSGLFLIRKKRVV
ncbi:hypothetical protein Plhal703r1_c32g0124191 [Plasmopara halstedii]